MHEYEAEVLYRPDSEELRFLPEGPYPCGPNRFSWVAIQHGAASQIGSLNIFDISSGQSESFELDGRPGFAFSTNQVDTFVIGIERQVRLFNTRTEAWTDLIDGIDGSVDGTIVNDAVAFDGGLILGTKELTFSEKKAGLYLWRSADWRLIQLRTDQICSNGKAMLGDGSQRTLLDIDSQTKTVVRYDLDIDTGTLSESAIVVDLRDGNVFPDGMIVTPDEQSVIVAIYNPNDAPHGEARQYGIEDGCLEAVWKTPQSPQVTCPQLIEVAGRVKLILTTAVERMPPSRQLHSQNAGCLFVADTDFKDTSAAPVFQVP